MLNFLLNPYVEVIIAGIAAGAWPLVMQRSGLIGAPVAIVYSAVSLIAAFGLLWWVGGFKEFTQGTSVNWWWAIGAGVLAALALLFLSDVVGKTSPLHLSTLYVLLLIVQISIPAIFYVVINHGVSLKQGIGFILAIVAAFLLS
ncbi:MAG: hypothetical protein Q7S11_05035 [bacterium]|nr:hypothetical protein [bacterium]